ncbi:sensor histidine kinase [Chitinophaga sancti]|uniref:Histidine kinase n=1 Tax=Chitinophaga sancti TaxID=1004 RepID=A0A1K1T2U0_9BACT|nr:histidine kinase [Chitinophaga sancti]WQD62126.1 histidine kinase [Chitinophaga sancti]WQG92305.1 histidine kinase [Chitinophaga sancti]SFW90961.1 Histidine kinase [Chitinophaga sancti]
MYKPLHKKTMDANWMLQLVILEKYRFQRHLSLIAFCILVLYYSPADYVEPFETYNRLVIFFEIILLAYGNMYFFVPKFLFRNKYLSYGLFLLSGMVLSYYVHEVFADSFERDLLPNEDDNINFFTFSFMTLVLIVASAAVKFFQRWISDTRLIHDLELANANSELEQLKNQINPHFLFNMLNNANVLIEDDPKKASQVLVKLSDLLRYQLYDSSREKVLLTSEIHFLEDFLNLEKVRRDNFNFLISKEGELSGVQVPPLLFISFVENAVKHNNDSAKLSYLNLYFDVCHDELFFKCVNSKPALKAVNKSGGLGLANIKRRLELLFPSLHDLIIEDNSETYCVTLTLKL